MPRRTGVAVSGNECDTQRRDVSVHTCSMPTMMLSFPPRRAMRFEPGGVGDGGFVFQAAVQYLAGAPLAR